MKTRPADRFPRVLLGYDPMAVDACIEELTAERQVLLDEIESLKTRLKTSGDEAAALRKEVALLNDTSQSPHAMAHRMGKLLRHVVDEVTEMCAEAKAEMEALVAAIESDAEDARRKHDELLAEAEAQRSATEAECAEAKKELEAELARMRAETQSAIEDAWQKAQQERDQLLADAKREADDCREQARRVVDEANLHQIKILEQLMVVYRGLEAVPAMLESAHQEGHEPSSDGVVVPFEQKSSAG